MKLESALRLIGAAKIKGPPLEAVNFTVCDSADPNTVSAAADFQDVP
jgi:hypothetical protein